MACALLGTGKSRISQRLPATISLSRVRSRWASSLAEKSILISCMERIIPLTEAPDNPERIWKWPRGFPAIFSGSGGEGVPMAHDPPALPPRLR